MKILATFANRAYDPEVIELIDAWDEFSVDENYEGFIESRTKAIESWGRDLLRWVTVEIEVADFAEVAKALDPHPSLQGEVGEFVE